MASNCPGSLAGRERPGSRVLPPGTRRGRGRAGARRASRRCLRSENGWRAPRHRQTRAFLLKRAGAVLTRENGSDHVRELRDELRVPLLDDLEYLMGAELPDSVRGKRRDDLVEVVV